MGWIEFHLIPLELCSANSIEHLFTFILLITLSAVILLAVLRYLSNWIGQIYSCKTVYVIHFF